MELSDILCVVPTEIHYSQSSISGHFASLNKKTKMRLGLNVTLEQLLNGDIAPSAIKLIEVVWFEGAWWCLAGHRRLYLFMILKELGVIHTVYVRVRDLSNPRIQREFSARKTTKNNGETMYCRGKESRTKLCATIAAWEQATGNTHYETEQLTGRPSTYVMFST